MSFPRLKANEIEIILDEMEIPFTKGFLTKPGKALSTEDVQTIFTSLLEYFFGITTDELSQIPSDVPIYNQFSESIASGWCSLSLFRLLYDLFSSIGYRDFRLHDLSTPDRNRFAFQLSALLNFAKFREEQLSKFAALEQATEALEQKLEGLKQQENEVLLHVKEIEDQEAAEREEVASVLQNIDELTSSIKEAHSKATSLNKETAELKQKISQIEADSEAIKLKNITVQQEIDVMSGKITDDPSTIREVISDLEKKVSHLEMELNEEQDKIKTLNKRKEVLRSLEESLPQMVNLLEKINTNRKKIQKITKTVNQVSGSAVENEKILEDLDVKTRHFEKKSASLNDQISRSQSSHELKREGYKQRRQELLSKIQEQKQIKGDVDHQCHELSEGIKKLKSELEALSSKRDAELTELSELISHTEGIIRDYHEKVSFAM
ncbi:hypothetical protein P9112_013080 [Eukaryota sp. TZLM1-RC]